MSVLPAPLNPTGRRRLLAPAVVIAVLAVSAAGSPRLITALEGTQGTGRPQAAKLQMDRLRSQGYIASLCTPEGTLMINPKTRRRAIVRYA